MEQKFDEIDTRLSERFNTETEQPPAKKAKLTPDPNSERIESPSAKNPDHSTDHASGFYEDNESYLDYGEDLNPDDNYESVYEDIYSGKEESLAAQVIFNTKEIPKLLANSKIVPPSTKNGQFSLCISDRITCLTKGSKQSNLAFPRFDVKSRDTTFNQFLSHANSRFLATEVPDDCFRIASITRPSLAVAYKSLARQQTVLKSLLVHAELVIDQFQSADKDQAQELSKIYILPIDAQIEQINETIRKIRAIALPKFLPPSLKKSIISASILPDKIWNIAPHIQSQIHSARTEYTKRQFPKPTTSRDSRPFQQRGRTFDRRARPQRRGGFFRRRFESKQDSQKNTKHQ